MPLAPTITFILVQPPFCNLMSKAVSGVCITLDVPVVSREAFDVFERTTGLEDAAEFLILTGRVRIADSHERDRDLE